MEGSLKTDTIISKAGLRNALNPEYCDNAILPGVNHADSARVHSCHGRADHDGSATSTSERRERQCHAHLGQEYFGERGKTLPLSRWKQSGVSGKKIQ